MESFFCITTACACHVPGVNRSADSSQCDGSTGQCACKSHVTGRACDMCRDNYWKLSTSNEAGCEGSLKPAVIEEVSVRRPFIFLSKSKVLIVNTV